MKIALIQIGARAEKKDSLALAKKYITKAAQSGADFAVLPEMFNFKLSDLCRAGRWNVLAGDVRSRKRKPHLPRCRLHAGEGRDRTCI